jgi:hypothetical protein
LSYSEASRAAEIGTSTGDRIMQRPENRTRVEQLRAGVEGDAAASVRNVVTELLRSDDEKTRAQAAAMVLRFPVAFADLPDDPLPNPDADLPAGCYRMVKSDRTGLVSDVILYPSRERPRNVTDQILAFIEHGYAPHDDGMWRHPDHPSVPLNMRELLQQKLPDE